MVSKPSISNQAITRLTKTIHSGRIDRHLFRLSKAISERIAKLDAAETKVLTSRLPIYLSLEMTDDEYRNSVAMERSKPVPGASWSSLNSDPIADIKAARDQMLKLYEVPLPALKQNQGARHVDEIDQKAIVDEFLKRQQWR